MQRRHFLATAALAAAPNVLTAAKSADPPLIVGHDVCVDSDENLYLCQWNSGKVPPYKLHRLPD